jgi:predicted cupin superfamily sugar epimerase
MTLSPAEIIDLLGLQPHPTCGFFRETYRSDLRVPANTFGRGYEGDRALGGVLYFLVTPEAPVRLHRIRSDQMYHHYLGDPLEVLLLYPDGKSEVRLVGSELAAGMRPQMLVPGATFHAARLPSGGKFSLLGTSVWLRAEPSDVEIGHPERLAAAYPAAREAIKAFTS